MEGRVKGGLWGVILGDALGFQREGSSRGYLRKNPIKDLKEGVWSDDSSLTLCLCDSLIKGFDLNDIAQNFIKWYKEGYLTPFGYPIGIGRTTRLALQRIMRGASPEKSGGKGEWSNGNGSLMRILPAAFYFKKLPLKDFCEKIHKISAITHAHPRSLIACSFYCRIIVHIIEGEDKFKAYYSAVKEIEEFYKDEPFFSELKHFSRILDCNIHNLNEDLIKSSGYVIDTLEASLWSFLTTQSFTDSLLRAVNLGGDTDTIGAVTGGLSGTYYGYEAIPQNWLNKIVKKDLIEEIIEKFCKVLS